MPLMVYPLLSLVLHRIIPTETPIYVESTVRIGIGSQLRDSGIETVVLLGYGLLQSPATTPIYIESVVKIAPRTPTAIGPSLRLCRFPFLCL